MATYRLFVECDYCGEIHPLPFAVIKEDIPFGIERVAEIYVDKEYPEDINSVISIPVHCPETGKYFVQKNDQKIFMAPV